MGAYIRGGLIYGERINGVLRYVQNVHCFRDITTICVTNEKLINHLIRYYKFIICIQQLYYYTYIKK